MKRDIKDRFKELLKEYAFIDNTTPDTEAQFLSDDMIFEDGEEEDEIDLSALGDLGDETEADSNTEMGGAPEGDIPADDMSMGSDEPEAEVGVEPKPELPNDGMDATDAEVEADADGDEIELDVTDLVNTTKAAKEKADQTNQKLDGLLAQIDQVLQSSVKIDDLANKVGELQDEIIKRNPSSVEKLEMQSLHSAPYNVKLGDYWKDKVGDYATDISQSNPTFDDIESPKPFTDQINPNDRVNQQPKEFIITQNDVVSDYNENEVKNSFDSYEEEEIDEY